MIPTVDSTVSTSGRSTQLAAFRDEHGRVQARETAGGRIHREHAPKFNLVCFKTDNRPPAVVLAELASVALHAFTDNNLRVTFSVKLSTDTDSPSEFAGKFVGRARVTDLTTGDTVIYPDSVGARNPVLLTDSSRAHITMSAKMMISHCVDTLAERANGVANIHALTGRFNSPDSDVTDPHPGQ